MLLLFSLFPAFAESPPAEPVEMVSIAGWDEGTYNDHLVAMQRKFIVELEGVARNAAPRTLAELEAYRQQARGVLITFVDDVRRVPPWKGDAGLRDALLASGSVMLSLYDVEIAELYAVCARPDIRTKDLDEAGAILARLNARSEATDDAVHEAQQQFARSHRLKLLPSEEPPPRPSFEREGLVPEGSPLTAGLVVAFATSWHNGVTADASATIEAMNTVMEAVGDDPEANATALSAAKASVQGARRRTEARGDWRGDRGYLDSTLALHDAAEGLINGTITRLVEARKKPFRTQTQVDNYNKDVDNTNRAFETAVDAFLAGQAAFQERSGMNAYAAWSAAQAK